MSVFRWIEVSLFLKLLLHLTAVIGQHSSSFVVRVGDEATLSCENVRDDQDQCDRTDWMFSDTVNTVELVRFGQISENIKSKSDRLSVTENCSLVIKKVTAEDVGRYICRQFDRSGRRQGSDTDVYLSVVTMTEYEDEDNVTLSCSVWTHGPCKHTVKWLYEGKDVDKDMETSQSPCLATVEFTTLHHLIYYKFFKCEVTDGNNRQQFTFSSQSSVTADDEHEGFCHCALCQALLFICSGGDGTTTTTTAGSGCSALNSIMLLMRVAELLLITVITVLLIRARGNQRPPDDNTVLNSVRSRAVTPSGPAASQVHNAEGEGDGRVNYENFRGTCVSARLH
ncbi:uncharacterized protein LOC108887483 [Lates calcarifer]|uniref:Uncharacterized protein LOC108887483 n=1 Tax=Lates calcarifer TaxID=8187 RepID=A0AAJ8B7F8_LATCA|nr:uncharacterized protein LOC108887483 [Lates calcarifer]